MKRFSKQGCKERGAAVVEMVIVLPLLFLLISGAIDLGDAWYRSTSIESAARAGAKTGFDAGNTPDHDLRVMRGVVAELTNTGANLAQIDRIVIYDASSTDTVPPACLTIAVNSFGGINNVCNVYRGWFINSALYGNQAHRFVEGECTTNADRKWCAQERGPSAANPDDPFRVGVYVSSTHNTQVGLLPFFKTFTSSSDTIVAQYDRS